MNVPLNLKVLDLTDEKGRLCSKLLADMGAEVIRVDRPGVIIAQTYANAGKKSISLDIETDRGRNLFRRLAKDCDAVIESFAPGYLSSLRLGYNELAGVNPQLIMVSISHFGQSGPYRWHKSSDLVASALGGQAYVCGEPDGPPLKPFGSQAYATAGLFAANGALLAVWQRRATKLGQHIDISVHECAAATLDQVLVRYFYEGVVAQRRGSLYWNNAFRIFPCQDGYILLSLFQQWETLIEWLRSENMAEDLGDEKYLIEAERLRKLDHIIAVLEKWTLGHTVDELVDQGQLMRFPWARVASIPDLVSNPQLKERGFFLEAVDTDSGKDYQFPGAPVKMSRSPWRIKSRVPRAGEDNWEIYHEKTGLTEGEMENLRREGII
jgi:benzylsuccinate CoA-transferase BbsE subunit